MTKPRKCKDGYDFKQLLQKYNLTVEQYFELREAWDVLSGKDQLIVLTESVGEMDGKND